MTITISSTKETVRIYGQLHRVWTGASSKGVPVRVCIAYIGAQEGYDHAEFNADLLSTSDPTDEEPLMVSKLVNIIKHAETE